MVTNAAADETASMGPNPAPVVQVTGVTFKWRSRDAFELAVPSFQVAPRERVLMVGPSGSGKSTFLNLVCGIAVPRTGEIRIMGTDLSTLRGALSARFRADHLGIIFQMFNLVPYLSCLENVLLPLNFSKERRRRVDETGTPEAEGRRLLDRLGLEAKTFAAKPAAEISVGQQQRVAAARALIGRPEIIIADEPTSALDRDLQKTFISLLEEEVALAGAALLMVSHDTSLMPLFDRVVPLSEIAGRESERGGQGVAAAGALP